MSETRVVAPATRKIGGARKIGGNIPPPAPEPPTARPRRRRGLLLGLALLLAAALGATVYLLVLAPQDPGAEPEPEPGITVAVEPRNINLADGHYLRLGFAVQLVAGADEIPVAPATDVAIALYSGRPVEEVTDPQRRAELQAELTQRLVEVYGEEVLAVYLTDYVTQ